MQTDPQITFHHFQPTEPVQKKLLEEIDRLERLDDSLIGCRVVIGLPERSQKKGNRLHVRVDLTRPGEEIVVDRHPPEHSADEDPLIAIGEAFDAVRKRLLQAKARRRRQVKRHKVRPRGRIVRLIRGDDYGFIQAEDGAEIYFHRNAVASGAFDQLEIGTPVSYSEEQGDKGPQATFVQP